MKYVVRSGSWRREIVIDDAEEFLDSDHKITEAATRVIEDVMRTGKNKTEGLSCFTQVFEEDLDIDMNQNPLSSEEDVDEFMRNVKEGRIKFIFTFVLLANAGFYKEADELFSILQL